MKLAQQNPDIALLYSLFKVVGGDPHVAARVARTIDALSSKLQNTKVENFGECKIEGVEFLVDVNDRFGQSCFYGSNQERLDLSIFKRLCSHSSVVWDIGANFGLYSAVCAAQLGETGIVQAVEPHRKALTLLKQNLDRNGLSDRVQIFEGALSDRDGTAPFFEAAETAFSGLSDTGRAEVETTNLVQTMRLDSLWKKNGSRPIDLMKIDVEGHEGAVLEGALLALAGSPDIIVQFELSSKNLNEGLRSQLHRILTNLEKDGWALWSSLETDAALVSINVEAIFDREEKHSGNIFLVRRATEREAQLLKIAEVRTLTEPRPLSNDELMRATRMLIQYHDEVQQAETQANEALVERMRNAFAFVNPDLRALTRADGDSSPPRPRDKLLMPAKLANVESLTIILRVTKNEIPRDLHMQKMPKSVGGVPCKLIVVDGRPNPSHALENSGVSLIAPRLQAEPQRKREYWNRYAVALRAALMSATTSHVALFDASAMPQPNALAVAINHWKSMSYGPQPVGAIAFPVLSGNDQPGYEETLGGMLALRHGLIACAAIRFIGLSADNVFAGDGFDLDLSLRLWHNGLDIIEAPASCLVQSDPAQRPTYRKEDAAILAQQWSGIYTHILLRDYFKPPGFRVL